MKTYTDKFNETQEERTDRIEAMLKCMVVESLIDSYRSGETPPAFTRNQIADFVGCSKDHIRRIEKSAMRKIRQHAARGKHNGR